MINQKMEDAFNQHLNAEIYSSYLYVSMSAALERMGLPGFANWMRIQAQEELAHSMKFYHHLIERGGKVICLPIEAPPTEWKSVLDMFKDTLKHEQEVSALVGKLMDLAIAEKDYPSNMFLQWFVSEQVEEEANVDDIIQKLNLTEEAKGALFLMDKDMGTRVFVPPTTE